MKGRLLVADAAAIVDAKRGPLTTALVLLAASTAGVSLLGSGSAAPPGSPVPDAPAAAVAPPPPPPEYCVERFVQPLLDAGLVPFSSPADASESSDPAHSGAEALPGARSSAGAGAAPTRPDPWRAVLEDGASQCSPVERVIVASIADPIDSGLTYLSDTALQALRLGAEYDFGGGGYFRDRGWLPWDDRDAPEARRSASEQCRKAVPGILLFRGHPRPGDPRLPFLAFLVVGETPTSGLQGVALQQALEVATRLLQRSCHAAASLELVGPTFSGSVHSLRRALSVWAERHPQGPARVHIRTGSATGSALAQLLRTPDAGAAGTPWLRDKQVLFSATIAPESAVLCSYLYFVHCRLNGACPGSRARRLSEVALLHESGTEFGATFDAPGSCPLVPAVDISFPAHVSRLRDAYEQMRDGSGTDSSIARRTSLDVSLREPRRPLDPGAEPSTKTVIAQDVALANVLETVSRSGVRHVGIVATEIADGIFLARKIRDVAPDVRLAFFSSDVLLLHPAFRRVLRGSLVVSPYPFLGTSWLEPPSVAPRRPHDGFENSMSLGIFNAVLAARGAAADQLREYTFASVRSVLPIWTSAIGRGGIEPISVAPARDPEGTILFGPGPLAAGETFEARLRARRAELIRSELRVEAGVTLPRTWDFTFALLCLLAFIDLFVRRRTLSSLSQEPLPEPWSPERDVAAELAIGRTKWCFYAAVRSYVLAFGITYMAMYYVLAAVAQSGSGWAGPGVAAALATLAGAVAVLEVLRFGRDYAALGRCVGAWSPLTWLSRQGKFAGIFRAARSRPAAGSAAARRRAHSRGWNRWAAPFGFADPRDRTAAARTSFGQLRLLANFALCIGVGFTLGQALVLVDDARWDEMKLSALPSTTLLAMRSLSLAGGASPAAPALLCVALAYAWSVGRMARLRLAHAVARVCPAPGVADLVSTPIRVILYPDVAPKDNAAEAFTTAERGVLNSILRPITGPYFAGALAVLIFLPVLLFTLKPLSTLERREGTWLLCGGFALATLLIGNTLLQLLQYWISLERLLKLTLQHRLGRAFTRVAGFVRDSVAEQVSRSPHDLLRLASCARLFDELVRAALPLRGLLRVEERASLEQSREQLLALAENALSRASRSHFGQTAAAEADLGREVVEAARRCVRILTRAWDGIPAHAPPPAPSSAASGLEERPQASSPGASESAGASRGPLSSDDALFAEAWRYSPGELRWLHDAEAFAATVSALLVSRHVRQFQYFVYGLTACSLLLLLALASYPFEPHRLLLTCIWGVVGSIVVVGLWVYLQIDRNSLLSRIAGSTPGKLTVDVAFVVRVITWGVLPLLSVAALQYPDFANAVVGWLDPFTRALR